METWQSAIAWGIVLAIFGWFAAYLFWSSTMILASLERIEELLEKERKK